jgi:hypothetical protein
VLACIQASASSESAPEQPLTLAAGKSFRDRLDAQPVLQTKQVVAEILVHYSSSSLRNSGINCRCALQVALCLILPAVVCAALYAVLRPATLSVIVAAGMGALYACLLMAVRALCLEHQYRVRPLPHNSFVECYEFSSLI